MFAMPLALVATSLVGISSEANNMDDCSGMGLFWSLEYMHECEYERQLNWLATEVSPHLDSGSKVCRKEEMDLAHLNSHE
jgi:hypothetical protein